MTDIRTYGCDVDRSGRSEEHADADSFRRALLAEVLPCLFPRLEKSTLLICAIQSRLVHEGFKRANADSGYCTGENDYLTASTCLRLNERKDYNQLRVYSPVRRDWQTRRTLVLLQSPRFVRVERAMQSAG